MQRSGHCSSLWRLVERGNTFYMANITWGGSGLAFNPPPAAPELTLCMANCSFCCCSSKSSQLWEHSAAFIKYLFLVISEGTGMKLSFLGFSFGSVDLKSKSQSPRTWQMVAGVDVSCNSTENRCVQGNCRGVVARKSRNGTLRPYAGVFIVKSASCFRPTTTWVTGRGLSQLAVPSGPMARGGLGSARTPSRGGGGDAGVVWPVSWGTAPRALRGAERGLSLPAVTACGSSFA